MRWVKPAPTAPIPETVEETVTLLEMKLYACAQAGINPQQILQALSQYDWPEPRQDCIRGGYRTTLPKKFEDLVELAGESLDDVAGCWGVEIEELLCALHQRQHPNPRPLM